MLMEPETAPLDKTFHSNTSMIDTDATTMISTISTNSTTREVIETTTLNEQYDSIRKKRYSRSIHLPVQTVPSPPITPTRVKSEYELSTISDESYIAEGREGEHQNNSDSVSIHPSSLGHYMEHTLTSAFPTSPVTPTTPTKPHKFLFKSSTTKTNNNLFESSTTSSAIDSDNTSSLLSHSYRYKNDRNRSIPSFRKLSMASAFPVIKEPAFVTARRGSAFSAISNISKISTSNTTNALKNFVSRSLGTAAASPADAAAVATATTATTTVQNNEKNPSVIKPTVTVSAPLKQSLDSKYQPMLLLTLSNSFPFLSLYKNAFFTSVQVGCANDTPANNNGSSSMIPSLPPGLKDDISCFAIDGFAQKYFATHKRGLFRRKVPMSDMLKWSKTSIKQPLIMINKDLNKDALKCFKLIQVIMGDRTKSRHSDRIEDIQHVLECGILKGQMRDEIYVQICKQLQDNPKSVSFTTDDENSDSIRKGWELLCIVSITFPPSKNLEAYLNDFVQQHHQNEQHQLNVYSQYISAKLIKICSKGAKGKVLTSAEIIRAKEAPFKPSVFGESLDLIMQLQREREREREQEQEQDSSTRRLQIPKLIPFLTNAVLDMNGKSSKGIFRVPGDPDGITELRVRIENDIYDTADIKDPNVPAALFKFWLRDLAEPLIPAADYADCIQFAEDPKTAIGIINRLPDIHRRIALVTISFLQEFAKAEVIHCTLMNVNNLAMIFAPNILRCPSESLATVFENSKHEQAFLRTLINHLKVNLHACIYDEDSSKAVGSL
ncbi:hypothetical protein BDF20DRAFT_837192 [Mycotypha africana]|uniref:uncharacterized protein n=1 Tax=Mycotypha africana TaxID=64632 RepID=UPI0023019E98|nr:uncharacterized protein BDF20DRAFT_837192 [Mycotypha africana]KAI8973225.1 hypothetical protein BDF20DRAFT_837192 [Mycotypha africana]